ncbi:MAG: CzcE family metal-binding protein [Pseudomonadota bacterium]
MKTLIALAVTASAVLAPGLAQASTSKTLMNGQSSFGIPVQVAQTQRVVDVASLQRSFINVTCGDVVTFKNGDRTFSWRFEVANHAAFDLQAIAPQGFLDKAVKVYVSRNDQEGG